MKKQRIVKLLSVGALLAILIVLVVPVISTTHAIEAPKVFPSGYWAPNGLVANENNHNICDLVQTVVNVIYFAITILFFLLIPVYIMYGGFLMLTSMGSTEKVDEGRKAITGAIIGAAIGLGAFMIIDVAVKFVVPNGILYLTSWKVISCDKIDSGIFKAPSN